MASDTKPPRRGRLRRALTRLWIHLCGIRFRLLLVNVLVVAVPLIGVSFARTFEREMLKSLENDMIHQAQLLREVLAAEMVGGATTAPGDDSPDTSGQLRLAGRSSMLARAARDTRTRIRLLDRSGHVASDSHYRGPPEGPEKPAPTFFGRGRDSYHAPEQPEPIDVSGRREVRVALRGRYGSATRMWENRDRVYLFSALPIQRPGSAEVLGVVYVTRSTAPVKFAMYRLRSWLFIILLSALGLTAILSLFLAATISRPLGKLTRIAKKIAAGDRGQRLALDRRDEIGELARAFDAMTARLDERARYTGDLAANISHEFKSPLTSIRGAAELLRDGAVEDVPARDKFLDNILEDTHRLDRLVTRLLELSRFEADTAATEVFDYEALVREVVESRSEAAERDIAVNYRSKTTQLRGRRTHIASALGNLIDNALQHADPDTVISVQIADGPGDTIRTEVGNRGVIISEAVMERIWDRFFTTRAKRGGTGLGLAIVASIVKAHGGRTAATSTAEHGTVFSFDLPRG